MDHPVDEEIQELMAKPELDEAEAVRLHLLLAYPSTPTEARMPWPAPRWFPRWLRRAIRRRALEDQ